MEPSAFSGRDDMEFSLETVTLVGLGALTIFRYYKRARRLVSAFKEARLIWHSCAVRPRKMVVVE
jgi:hypothetical protein